MYAVKSINLELESWLGIWNFGLESEIFYKKPWDFESYARFHLGVRPLAAHFIKRSIFENTRKCFPTCNKVLK